MILTIKHCVPHDNWSWALPSHPSCYDWPIWGVAGESYFSILNVSCQSNVFIFLCEFGGELLPGGWQIYIYIYICIYIWGIMSITIFSHHWIGDIRRVYDVTCFHTTWWTADTSVVMCVCSVWDHWVDEGDMKCDISCYRTNGWMGGGLVDHKRCDVCYSGFRSLDR